MAIVPIVIKEIKRSPLCGTHELIYVARFARNFLLDAGIPCRVTSRDNVEYFILETTTESFAEIGRFILEGELLEWDNGGENMFPSIKSILEHNNFI